MSFGDVLEDVLVKKQKEDVPYKVIDWLADAERKLTTAEIIHPAKTDTAFRVSKIVKMCPRQEVLRHIYNIPMTHKTDHKLRRTFDFGNAFHSLVQNQWFGKWGWLHGDWKCTDCGEMHLDMLRPNVCRKCLKENLLYVEVFLHEKELGITGHPDGFLVRDGVKHLLELKTSNSRMFKYITEQRGQPTEEHLDQVNLYMHLTGVDRGVILYFEKDESAWFQYPQRLNTARVEASLRKVKQTRDGLKTGDVPKREVCPKEDCSRAKACPVRQHCFST